MPSDSPPPAGRLAAPLAALRRYVRLRPFDTSTAEGRSCERYRRAALSALASLLARLVAIAALLVTVPLTLHYLGPERYGMWMTIVSVISVLSFADLGVGNGLLNALSAAEGRGDRRLAATLVSSACCMLLGAAALLGLTLLALYPFVPWPDVLNVTTPDAAREAGPALAVCALCFMAGLALDVVPRVRAACQEGYTASLWAALGSLLGLAAVLWAVRWRVGLPLLALAAAGTPLLAVLANGLALFGATRPWLRPRWSLASRCTVRRLLGVGIFFLMIQVAHTTATAADNLIISHLLGPGAVPAYAVPARLFALAPMLLGMAVNPLWPAYSEALTRGDVGWARRTLRRSVWLTLACTLLPGAALLAAGVPLLHLWVGPSIRPSFSLRLGLALWAVCSSLGGTLSMFLNAANLIRLQAACSLMLAVCGIGLKVFAGRRAGLEGIVWAGVLAYLACVLLPYALRVPAALREALRAGGQAGASPP